MSLKMCFCLLTVKDVNCFTRCNWNLSVLVWNNEPRNPYWPFKPESVVEGFCIIVDTAAKEGQTLNLGKSWLQIIPNFDFLIEKVLG